MFGILTSKGDVVVSYVEDWHHVARFLPFWYCILGFLPLMGNTVALFFFNAFADQTAMSITLLAIGWTVFAICLWILNDKLILSDEGVKVPTLLRLPNRRDFYYWHDVVISVEAGGFKKVVLEFPVGDPLVLKFQNLSLQDKRKLIGGLKDHTDTDFNHSEEFQWLENYVRDTRVYAGEIETPSGDSFLDQKQLTLRYATKVRLLLLVIDFLLFPIWFVAAALGIFALPFFWHELGVKLLLCPVMLISGLAATTALYDIRIKVGEDGISFPLYLAPLMQFRRDRLWAELTRLRFRANGRNLGEGTIDFLFSSGTKVSVGLKDLSEPDMERFLLALNIWAQRVEQDPEIRVLHETVSNKKLGLGETNYTKLWEDEMNRKFSSTNFIPLQVGAQLKSGKLVVLKQLAFGGMSAIYQVQHNQTELLTLKEFVVPDLGEDLKSKASELFERESTILMRLSHPSLARVHDYFVENGKSYLLLDFIPGTDLRELVIQKGKQSEEEVIKWVLDICEILQYLHGQSPPVVHRDLTPDNILLKLDGRITLIDFGAANEFLGTATGTLVGKQCFIAPEQFRGDTVPASDLYSLGATMYYLLTGVEPRALTQSFPKEHNEQVSDWLNQLVGDCMAFDLEQRITDAKVLALRLKRQGN